MFRSDSFQHRELIVSGLCALSLVLLQAGCGLRTVVEAAPVCEEQPLRYDQNVDILFVIDNSVSMEDNQQALAKNFPVLIESLRTPTLGPDGSGKPCNELDRRGCNLPNLHVGVVSTDLGVQGGLPGGGCNHTGGDGGKLQSTARMFQCQTPYDRWISYKNGNTNVPGSKGQIQNLKDAFSCIARLGAKGCGYEQPLEAAYMALNPALKINPGFLRNKPGSPEDALLAVVFITDEDDCSIKDPRFTEEGFPGALPYCKNCIFRCFQYGVRCEPGGVAPGPRKNCKPEPTGKYLHTVDRYTSFFKGLKQIPQGSQSRILMAAISGPARPVVVGKLNGGITLNPSCKTAQGQATPAIRLERVVHAFARELQPSEIKSGVPFFVDDQGTKRAENIASICSADFSPPLRRLGRSIVSSLRPLCLKRPPLTASGNVACAGGDILGKDLSGKPVKCQRSCLDRADFTVTERLGDAIKPVSRCPANLFSPAVKVDGCGASCPCWRIVRNSQCAQKIGQPPYAVQVMRTDRADSKTRVNICSNISRFGWGSQGLAQVPQCQ